MQKRVSKKHHNKRYGICDLIKNYDSWWHKRIFIYSFSLLCACSLIFSSCLNDDFAEWHTHNTHMRVRTQAFAHQRKGRARNEIMQSSQFWQKKREEITTTAPAPATTADLKPLRILAIEICVCSVYGFMNESSNMRIIFARIERGSKRNHLFSVVLFRSYFHFVFDGTWTAFKYIKRASRFACSSRRTVVNQMWFAACNIQGKSLLEQMYPLGKRAGRANKAAQSEPERVRECARARQREHHKHLCI